MQEETFHLTHEQWEALEPVLQQAEAHAHEEFFASEASQDLLRTGSEETPGNILLHYLREKGDETAVRLFRAMELYQHELVRHDIAAAYHLGESSNK